jgi:ubiquinone biosynthesis protein Coq4
MLGRLTKEGQESFELFHYMTNLYKDCIGEIKKFKEMYHIEFSPLPKVMIQVNHIFNNKKHMAFLESVIKDKRKKEEMIEMIRDFQAFKDQMESVEIKVRNYMSKKKMDLGKQILISFKN